MNYKLVVIFLSCWMLGLNSLYGQTDQVNSDSIMIDFGNQIDSFISYFDLKSLNNAFDADYYTQQFFLVDSTEQKLNEFNEEYYQVCDTIMSNLVRKSVAENFYYDFVNYYQDYYGNYYLIFRLFGEMGLNYHELLIVYDELGNPKIGDIYIYFTGELLSQTMSQFYYPGITKILNESYFNKKKKALFESYEKLHLINFNIQRKRNLEAIMLYNSIPKEIQEEKIFLLYGLKLTSPDSNPKKYVELVEKLNEKYPNNPTIYLWNIDRYFIKGDFEKALAMVDSLMNITGDDFLDFYKGNIHHASQDYQTAEKHYHLLTQNYPAFEDGFTSLFEICIINENFKLAAACVDVLVNRFRYEKSELIKTLETDYVAFSQSEDFINWKNKE